jgi:hypothetical protein
LPKPPSSTGNPGKGWGIDPEHGRHDVHCEDLPLFIGAERIRLPETG